MALVGNLRDFGLSDFLYLVDRGYKTGCLHLERGNDSASLYFDKGKLVTAGRIGGQHRVTEVLVQRGKLTQEQAIVASGLSHNGTPLSHILLEHNVISREDLQRTLQQHIEESVYSLFGWPDGEFRFEQNQRPASDAPIVPVPISVENIIMEGVRRIDEWGRIKDRISSTDLVVRFVEQSGEKAKGVNLSAQEWRVFARINGKQTLSEIAQKTNLGEFEVCRIVYGFLTAGLVELQKRPRPVAAGERATQEPPKVKKSLVSRIINRIRGM